MRIKTPAQPLLFRFRGVTALMAAVATLYGAWPAMGGRLSLFQGRYYLLLAAGLSQRGTVRCALMPYGEPLGASPVLYAFFAEHGRELSRDAVAELGRAMGRRGSGE